MRHRPLFVVSVLVAAFALCSLCLAGKYDWIDGKKDSGKDATSKEDAEPKIPKIRKPVLFNTPEADILMSKIRLVPDDSPWKWDISKLPVAKNSKQIVASIGTDANLRACWEMAFVIVPPDQPKIDVKITRYARESDPGPYPVPRELPIQGWPMYGGDLANVQRNGTGDRHAIVLDPYAGKLYEFYDTRLTDAGWTAAHAAVFDVPHSKLRPDGWTSSDAAGLPVLMGVIRYDEVERGPVAHAMRLTVPKSRRAYLYPARHQAGHSDDPNLPRMGERIRLRADFDVSKYPRHAQAILLGLKKYGTIVADNGGPWDLCVTPDTRIQGMQSLKQVKGSDFEVVDVSELIAKAAKK